MINVNSCPEPPSLPFLGQLPGTKYGELEQIDLGEKGGESGKWKGERKKLFRDLKPSSLSVLCARYFWNLWGFLLLYFLLSFPPSYFNLIWSDTMSPPLLSLFPLFVTIHNTSTFWSPSASPATQKIYIWSYGPHGSFIFTIVWRTFCGGCRSTTIGETLEALFSPAREISSRIFYFGKRVTDLAPPHPFPPKKIRPLPPPPPPPPLLQKQTQTGLGKLKWGGGKEAAPPSSSHPSHGRRRSVGALFFGLSFFSGNLCSDGKTRRQKNTPGGILSCVCLRDKYRGGGVSAKWCAKQWAGGEKILGGLLGKKRLRKTTVSLSSSWRQNLK